MKVTGTDIEVQVLHRLALGVEPFDTLTGRRVRTGELRVERVPAVPVPRRPRDPYDPWAPVPEGVPLESNPGGRFRLRHGAGVGAAVQLRLWDRKGAYAPRQFSIPLWTRKEVLDLESAGTDLPALSRVLRPWLLPGTAASVPVTATGLRGHVVRAGVPVPWARVTAVAVAAPALTVQAAADHRGDFLLVVPGTRRAPGGTFDLAVTVSADPAAAPVPDAAHRFDSLPVEHVPRTPIQYQDADLDNPLLRGEQLPAAYVQGKTKVVTMTVGLVRTAAVPLEFDPH